MVSGTISLPSRGTFHHSLTVLIHYRSSGSIQAYRVVPADSQQISRARCYSGTTSQTRHTFSRTGLSPSPAHHPKRLPLTHTLDLTVTAVTEQHCPTTPHTQPPPGITRTRFSHHPLSLATTHGITQLFSLPAGTEMFHFPAFPPHRLYIQRQVTRHHSCWVSPFGHPRITARLTAPRGLSRPPTSFIGS